MIEKACHRLEDILARARDGEQPLDAEAFRVLFATADAIEDAGARLRDKHVAGSAPPTPPARRATPRGPPRRPRTGDPAPPPSRRTPSAATGTACA